MSTPNYWIGNAPATTHVFSFVLSGTASGSGTFTVTIGMKSVSTAFATSDTAAVIAANTLANLQASTIPEFIEVQWSLSTATIFGTAAQAGVPITYATNTPGSGIVVASSDVVPATGPNWISNGANWSGGLPVTGQDAVVASGPDILYGLDAPGFPSTPDSFRILRSFTGSLGLGDTVSTAKGQYTQYRPVFFSCPCTTVVIGEGVGAGSARVRLSLPNAGNLIVKGTAAVPGNSSQAAIQVVPITGHTVASLQVYGGSVSYGGLIWGNPTTTITTLTVNGNGATCNIGTTHTVTTANVQQGSLSTSGTTTTLNLSGGTYTQDNGSVGTINATAGKAVLNHQQAGAILATFTGGGKTSPVLDASGTSLPKVLNASSAFTRGAALLDPAKSVTAPSGVTFDGPSVAASNLGPTFTITR